MKTHTHTHYTYTVHIYTSLYIHNIIYTRKERLGFIGVLSYFSCIENTIILAASLNAMLHKF